MKNSTCAGSDYGDYRRAATACHRQTLSVNAAAHTLIFLHAIILMVGGQDTYAKVPVGFEVQDWSGFSCNPDDKLGHFFHGPAPALVAPEILVRGCTCADVNGGVPACRVALAISAMYELIEWWQRWNGSGSG
ncbi:DUF2238 domain-containing protein [Shigella flexneri]